MSLTIVRSRDAGEINGEKIKRLRETLGLTQAAFALRLGVDRRSVVRWENGKAKPHPVWVERMRELK